MKTSLFDYELPEELIAAHPMEPRDASRLMRLGRRTGEIMHCHFHDLPDLLRGNDVLVINNSRVLPARLYGRRLPSRGNIEVLLLKPGPPGTWWALVKPGKKIQEKDRLEFGDGLLQAEVVHFGGKGERLLRFDCEPEDLDILIEKLGVAPLPPYILKARRRLAQLQGKKTSAARLEIAADKERYQTLYAQPPGSVAAPTAGLHFTQALLTKLRERGHEIVEVTLHVGPGTFKPVEKENVEEHPMHVEQYSISPGAAAAINRARHEGRRIVAVGTTTVRVLETVARETGQARAETGLTDLLITPGFEFRLTDVLLTNYHLPRSTLLMLVSAFAGQTLTMRAYREAIAEKYRFYSYGDAMLIE
ncbi:MAG: tRNA preQ1(34) S-adenosylmethionine ribosyltransferase-isomerase QueA [Candidatus Sumerlaeota bacterium]|nr:tRNA preQ1(34) S-adenosylmethionine ribosyltransferase-isomerase QueA [Candidatus Sumerlaeota bacterium]